jgi:hypothetical protein
MAVQVSYPDSYDVPSFRADVQSVLSNLLKTFDDRPISHEKRAAVNAKLDQGVERIRGLKRKV